LSAFLILSLSPSLSSQIAPRPSGANAKTADTSLLLRRFEERYQRANSLSATFLERYRENGRVARVEAGEVYFLRPGKMRWEYESPEKNLFLVDGKTAWFYVPADHTVTRVPAKESADWRTPLALLAGKMKLSRLCGHVEIATDEKPDSQENVLFRCALRGQSSETTSETSQERETKLSGEPRDAVFFEIVRQTAELARILSPQSGGVSVEFRFAKWQFDPHLTEASFHFAPPKGVAIVNGELPAENSAVR